MSRRLVDLSHPFGDGDGAYPGMPQPRVTPHLTREASREHYAPGTEFAIDTLTMVGNTGTYLDAPWHRYPDGADLAGLPLTSLADLPALVLTAVAADGGPRGVDVAALEPLGDVAGAAVLLHTGWDARWGTPGYAGPAPFLTEAGARWLVERGAALVGIDSVNIDDTSPDAAGRRPAHSVLLAAALPVVEHLTRLGDLPATGARFSAVPPAVTGFGTFPVRAWARCQRDPAAEFGGAADG